MLGSRASLRSLLSLAILMHTAATIWLIHFKTCIRTVWLRKWVFSRWGVPRSAWHSRVVVQHTNCPLHCKVRCLLFPVVANRCFSQCTSSTSNIGKKVSEAHTLCNRRLCSSHDWRLLPYASLALQYALRTTCKSCPKLDPSFISM
jgi:hypothetical protein